METLVLDIHDSQAIPCALETLRAGQVIAYPTDTVYGVGANALDARAVEQLFVVKDRPRDKAMPVLLADARDLALVAREIPDAARVLAEKFWPGALTIVVPALPRLPKTLLADDDTIGARVPNHDALRALIRALGAPLVGTSANLSGAPNPQTAPEVLAQLGGRIPLILDGGATRGDVPSTVVDVSVSPPVVRRVGAVAVDEIEEVLGRQVNKGSPDLGGISHSKGRQDVQSKTFKIAIAIGAPMQQFHLEVHAFRKAVAVPSFKVVENTLAPVG